ncbi:MAG: hypothetical protein EOP62_07140 [Sphingomonadales bacterium]|nr:MAG: hypothetical protein EOP62_07140 [Sphingomonadales bacterium]
MPSQFSTGYNSPHSTRGVVRSPLARLRITTEHCPQVTLRVLDLLGRNAVIPWVIKFSRRPRSLLIELEVEDVPPAATAALANRIAAIVKVRSVRVLGKRSRTGA